jgi:GTPase SAR1 family protein
MGCDMSFLGKAKLSSREGDETAPGLEKRILFLGLDNAGKTSILYYMRDKEFK